MNFGQALEFMKRGQKLTRKGWNGRGMYVTKKDLHFISGDKACGMDNPCLVLYNVHGNFNTWVPSITDLFAEDWIGIEE